MNFKNVISTLLLATTLTTALTPKKSEAAVFLVAAGAVACVFACEPVTNRSDEFTSGGKVFAASAIMALPTTIVGGVIAAGLIAQIVPMVGTVMLILDENGNVSQDKLEAKLTEKYPFIADREAISNLALTIKNKAKETMADKDGNKMVSLSEIEVAKVLEAADLSNEEMKQIVSDLK